jgi:hypothetical protein
MTPRRPNRPYDTSWECPCTPPWGPFRVISYPPYVLNWSVQCNPASLPRHPTLHFRICNCWSHQLGHCDHSNVLGFVIRCCCSLKGESSRVICTRQVVTNLALASGLQGSHHVKLGAQLYICSQAPFTPSLLSLVFFNIPRCISEL